MPKKVSPELMARAIRMVAEHQEDYPSVTAASQAVAKQLRLGRETVRRWVVQAVEVLQGGDVFLRGRTRLPQPLIMVFIDDMRAQGHAVIDPVTGHLCPRIGGGGQPACVRRRGHGPLFPGPVGRLVCGLSRC